MLARFSARSSLALWFVTSAILHLTPGTPRQLSASSKVEYQSLTSFRRILLRLHLLRRLSHLLNNALHCTKIYFWRVLQWHNNVDAVRHSILRSQSKWLGHFGVPLSPKCWCTRFGDGTAMNNFERDEGSTRRKKNSVWLKCPNYFCLRLCRGGIWRRVERCGG